MSSSGATDRARAESLPQIFGRYLLVQRLSRGGMGEIFLARHGLSGFEKLVVIKKILPNLAADEEFISRFIDEAQVAVNLQHANIAQVFEVGRVKDEYFLAIEYIEGRDLRRTLSVLAQSGRSLPVDLALFIARDVANALSYAHRRTDANGEPLELVHCDISPPNIMMSFEGETKIIDFGIAKSALKAVETDAKRGFGKFGYMSPEQLIRGRRVDFRTDIYATGVILYEMLTGRRLYEVGDTPDYRALARMVSKGQHGLPSDHDPALSPYDELVSRALAPDPKQRYPTAAAFRDAIQTQLVAVNPTISPDQLSAFMRFLFADDVIQQRRKFQALDQTRMDQWRDELSHQSQSTVSFAASELQPTGVRTREQGVELAPDDEGDTIEDISAAAKTAPRGESVDIAVDDAAAPEPSAAVPEPSAAPDKAIAAVPSSPTALPTALVALEDSAELTREPVRRSWGWIAVLAVVAAAAGGVAVALVMHDRDTGQVAGGQTPPPSSAASETVPTAPAAEPSVEPPIPEPVVTPITDTPAAEPAVAAKAPASEPRPRSPRPRSPRPRTPRPGKQGANKPTPPPEPIAKPLPAPAAPAAIDPAAVRGKFSRVTREYRGFKKRFGGRLEAEWNDLASYATFASGPDKLKDFDQRIDQFRRKMGEVRRAHGD